MFSERPKGVMTSMHGVYDVYDAMVLKICMPLARKCEQTTPLLQLSALIDMAIRSHGHGMYGYRLHGSPSEAG